MFFSLAHPPQLLPCSQGWPREWWLTYKTIRSVSAAGAALAPSDIDWKSWETGEGADSERAGHGRIRSCSCHSYVAPTKSVVLNLFSFKAPAISFTEFKIKLSGSLLGVLWSSEKLWSGAFKLNRLTNTDIDKSSIWSSPISELLWLFSFHSLSLYYCYYYIFFPCV